MCVGVCECVRVEGESEGWCKLVKGHQSRQETTGSEIREIGHTGHKQSQRGQDKLSWRR